MSRPAVFMRALGIDLAAGAMIFVVSHEVISVTHRNGHQAPATIGLKAGFAVMMVATTRLNRQQYSKKPGFFPGLAGTGLASLRD